MAPVAVLAKPANARRVIGRRWRKRAVASTTRERTKRTAPISTWSISVTDPSWNMTASGLGSVFVEKTTKRLAYIPSRNWTMRRLASSRESIWILKRVIEGNSGSMFWLKGIFLARVPG